MAATATANGLKNQNSSDPKILVIGFNRCGTTSLHRLFKDSGVVSIHFQGPDEKNIAKRMMINIGLGLAPLHGYENIRAFSDMAFLNNQVLIEGSRFFRELANAYPDAYFILNTRPVEGWIASRVHHSDGSYLDRSIRVSQLNKEALLDQWRDLFTTHTREVTEHFRDHPRFLEFDITTDNPQSIADFLAPDFTIDPSHWSHRNAGAPSQGLSYPPTGAGKKQTSRQATGG